MHVCMQLIIKRQGTSRGVHDIVILTLTSPRAGIANDSDEGKTSARKSGEVTSCSTLGGGAYGGGEVSTEQGRVTADSVEDTSPRSSCHPWI